MKKLNQLLQVESLLEVRYQKQQQSFQRLVAHETRLRNDIMRLKENAVEMRASLSEDAKMRAVGADIAWQAWLGRKKAALNGELVQVLAIKEHHLKQVRTAYGKLIVARDLAENLRGDIKTKKARDELAQAVNLFASK
ncbi:hypothetical protein [Sulfitobacter sp.]|jgi:hypothetical protein|uniref:hypothetical protein n=1 Tax=Sulfitobacter sp. TaxID=1903071 RepID=UPI0035653A73|tara:strand:- start:1881 stop:2294 length:414 start_codon:yes stop_codon:yes gene_type:complete